MRRAAFFLLSACGRLGFSDMTARDAAGADGADATDAPDAVPPGFCATAQFTNPPASSLQDDFTTPYTARWAPINPTAPCINQVGTELVATPASNGEYCFADTIGDFHLTCDAITMRVPEILTLEVGAQTFIYVESLPTGQVFNMIVENGLQIAEVAMPRIDTAQSSELAEWWRLGEHDGVVTFDVSADGVTWQEVMRGPTPFSFDHVLISIGAGTYKPVTSPGQARFRCYNLPPPCN